VTSADEELLAEWLLCWEEAQEQGRAVSAAELAGDRLDLVGELAWRIEVLRETAWLDAPLEFISSPEPASDGDAAGRARAGDWRGGVAAIEPHADPARTLGRGRLGSLLPLVLAGCGAVAVVAWLVLTRPVGPPASREAGGEPIAEAENAFFQARYDVADTLFTDVLLRNPHDRRARLSRGISRLKLGRFEDAVADFTAVLEHGVPDREPLRQRAQAHVYLRQYDAAIADLEWLLTLGPDTESVRQRLDALKAVRDAGRPGAGDPGREPGGDLGSPTDAVGPADGMRDL
jgi:tetratricopeptide (TPR) repeat protein